MSLIPENEFKKQASINLAPMVDFLFLILAVFAVMAITRAALFDSEISLVKLKPEKKDSSTPAYNEQHIINISITEEGQYKWITEVSEFLLPTPEGIVQEIAKQQKLGLLPQKKEQTKVLLHIDKDAHWEPIAQAIFSLQKAGFSISPVYEPEE